MSVIDRARQVPRTVVGAGLGAARVPLSVAARAARQQGNEEWPPAVAFHGFEGNVETVVGSLLRDRTLVERGRLKQAKVAQLRRAAELETLADAHREKADQRLTARREQARRQSQNAAADAARAEQRLERQEQAKVAQADRAATAEKHAIEQAKASQDQALTTETQLAAVESLTGEAEALQVERAALEADKQAEVLDETIDASRAARDRT